MYKGKEWLKEELTKQIDILHTTISSGNYVKLVKRAEIMDLIDQLDKPKITEEHAWKTIAKSTNRPVMFWENMRDNYLSSLKEPELPAIPQFVADWIKYAKNTDITLYGAMDNESLNTQELTRWMTDGKNQLKFARAWLYGYEIEIEKLYFVKESTTGQFLVRDIQQSNGVKWVDGFSTKSEYYTEQQIKEINTRYWAFAEEVTV